MIEEDIRQSENWAKHLQTLGWKSQRTKSNTNVEILDKYLIKIAKIQRPNKLDKEEIHNIEQMCTDQNVTIVKIEPKTNDEASILLDFGFIKTGDFLTPPKTIVIELKKPKAELLSEVSKRTRYYIRKAETERSHVYIYRNPDISNIESFYRVYKASAVHNKNYRDSLQDIKNKVECFGENAFIAISHNEDGGICGANLYLAHKNCVWYMHGGIKRTDENCAAGYKLMWETITYMKDIGFEYFDLEGVYDKRYKGTKKWKGFTFYKSRFGGKEIEYPGLYTKYNNTILRNVSKLYPL